VTAAVPESQQPIIARKVTPEAMTLGLNETKQKMLSIRAAGEILQFVKKRKVTSVVLGPGIGTNKETCKFVNNVIKNIEVPLVLDADGLNCLADTGQILKSSRAKIVITPHPGEMSRLTNLPIDEINRNRINIAVKFSKENRVVCILKGHETVITDGKNVFINTTGNPGMATGGSGDVLSGMIAGFFSQVEEPKLLNACLSAVYLHGLAGDMAKKEKGEISMIAGDIIEKIPQAVKKVINDR
jgi:NAD(P)H-hydrate epimerase